MSVSQPGSVTFSAQGSDSATLVYHTSELQSDFHLKNRKILVNKKCGDVTVVVFMASVS